MLEAALTGYATDLAESFVSPQKRLFVGYLLCALAIALAFLVLSKRDGAGGIAAAWRQIFSRRIWWSASSRADYIVTLVNQALMMLVAPYLLTQLALATFLFHAFHDIFGGRPSWGAGLPDGVVAAAFTLTFFLADDFSRYAVHRLMHRWAFLWALHKVHHTAETLTPLTVLRTHPLEGVLFTLRSVIVQAGVISLFVFAFAGKVDLVTVWGVNALLFVFNVAGANLRHSQVSLSYPRWLERIFISPAQHQVHHSVETRHHDRNFGVTLALWDWLGGSLCHAEPGQRLRYGVAGVSAAQAHGLHGLYIRPLVDSLRALADGTRAVLARLVRSKGSLPMTDQPTGHRRAVARRAAAVALAALALLPVLATDARAAEELDIYSHRQPYLIDPFVKAYTAETGVTVNIVYATSGLAQRMLAEGKRSPADLVLTVDIGRLRLYADKDLLAPVDSAVLQRNVPAHLRAADNSWFALSKRVRILAVAKGRVAPGDIARMEDLADPRWKGRVCTRPGSAVYNRALMASMIAAHGEAGAEAWARGLVANLARRPQGDDRAQVKAIFEGQCDIAIINHYYYGNLRSSDVPEHRQWADAVDIVFTNQEDRGVHVNISGGGVAKYADNREGAIRFLEFLSGEQAQKLYGEVNSEYPVNPAVQPSENVRSLGTFKEDTLPIETIADLAPQAQMIIDRVGW